jgi:hypothetical protein
MYIAVNSDGDMARGTDNSPRPPAEMTHGQLLFCVIAAAWFVRGALTDASGERAPMAEKLWSGSPAAARQRVEEEEE